MQFTPYSQLVSFITLPFDVGPLAWPLALGKVWLPRESPLPAIRPVPGPIECADRPAEDEEDAGDEEDLAVAQPAADEESSFDDFDDEFDDDFEEESNDPDWDHPDDAAPEAPPPGKGGGRKK